MTPDRRFICPVSQSADEPPGAKGNAAGEAQHIRQGFGFVPSAGFVLWVLIIRAFQLSFR